MLTYLRWFEIYVLGCSKGRKHGGKVITLPTDFSDVLDFQSTAAVNVPNVHEHFSALLNAPVISLCSHPGDPPHTQLKLVQPAPCQAQNGCCHCRVLFDPCVTGHKSAATSLHSGLAILSRAAKQEQLDSALWPAA